MKTRNIVLLTVALTLVAAVGFLLLLPTIICELGGYGDIYETNDIADYGNITGTFMDKEVKAYIFSFFPSDISSEFKDPQYHYKAVKGDGYAFECWLEFVVEDDKTFKALTERYTDSPRTSVFAYDQSFMDYTIDNHIDLANDLDPSKTLPPYHILSADIGKILFRQEDRRIICLAMGMYDGGYATTEHLSYFFTRFSIDPLDFEQQSFRNPRENQEYWENQGAGSVIPFP